MKVLIVYAHPEPKSFNGSMRDTAVSVLTQAGHSVQISDLYAMKFKAVADAEDTLDYNSSKFFKYQVEQKLAFEKGTLAPDIQIEQQKLMWCNFLILQFPLWWFSLPGIMKGWVDRVFTTGFAYGGGMWYDQGGLHGRKAMLALTTGGPPGIYSVNGLNGDIEQILYPINHGILYFVGFQVLSPFIAWSVAHTDDTRRYELLEQYKQRLLSIDSTPPIPYPSLADYDENYQLKVKT